MPPKLLARRWPMRIREHRGGSAAAEPGMGAEIKPGPVEYRLWQGLDRQGCPEIGGDGRAIQRKRAQCDAGQHHAPDALQREIAGSHSSDRPLGLARRRTGDCRPVRPAKSIGPTDGGRSGHGPFDTAIPQPIRLWIRLLSASFPIIIATNSQLQLISGVERRCISSGMTVVQQLGSRWSRQAW